MTPTSELTGALDRAFDVLGHAYRRRVLHLVDEHSAAGESPLSVDDVVRRIDDEGVALRLRHTHLPKLADIGYVEWDETSGTIRAGPVFDEIEPLVELLTRHQDELPGEWP
jgi:hypothetical protein